MAPVVQLRPHSPRILSSKARAPNPKSAAQLHLMFLISCQHCLLLSGTVTPTLCLFEPYEPGDTHSQHTD